MERHTSFSIIVISVLLLVFASIVNASKIYEHNCAIELVNNTSKAYVFWLKWIDHPFLHQTQGRPWNKIVAKIGPGESFVPESEHAPGLYAVVCRERWKPNSVEITRDFTILPETREIIITAVTVLPMEIPIITLSCSP